MNDGYESATKAQLRDTETRLLMGSVTLSNANRKRLSREVERRLNTTTA